MRNTFWMEKTWTHWVFEPRLTHPGVPSCGLTLSTGSCVRINTPKGQWGYLICSIKFIFGLKHTNYTICVEVSFVTFVEVTLCRVSFEVSFRHGKKLQMKRDDCKCVFPVLGWRSFREMLLIHSVYPVWVEE